MTQIKSKYSDWFGCFVRFVHITWCTCWSYRVPHTFCRYFLSRSVFLHIFSVVVDVGGVENLSTRLSFVLCGFFFHSLTTAKFKRRPKNQLAELLFSVFFSGFSLAFVCAVLTMPTLLTKSIDIRRLSFSLRIISHWKLNDSTIQNDAKMAEEMKSDVDRTERTWMPIKYRKKNFVIHSKYVVYLVAFEMAPFVCSVTNKVTNKLHKFWLIFLKRSYFYSHISLAQWNCKLVHICELEQSMALTAIQLHV